MYYCTEKQNILLRINTLDNDWIGSILVIFFLLATVDIVLLTEYVRFLISFKKKTRILYVYHCEIPLEQSIRTIFHLSQPQIHECHLDRLQLQMNSTSKTKYSNMQQIPPLVIPMSRCVEFQILDYSSHKSNLCLSRFGNVRETAKKRK